MNTRLTMLALVTSVCLASSAIAQTENGNDGGTVRTFADLLTLLNNDSVTHKTEADEKLVLIPVEKGQLDSVMVIRWADEDGVVHFLQPITTTVPDERLAAVESAMIRLNHAMPYPGLGMNHNPRTIYFRMTVPVRPGGGLSAAEIRQHFRSTLAEAAGLQRTIAAVISGDADAENIVAIHNQLQSGSGEFPVGEYTREMGGSRWALKFSTRGSVVVTRDGQEMVRSRFNSRGNRVVFMDQSGPLAVEGQGVYTWKSTADGIVFGKQTDVSQGRAMVLTSGTWSPAGVTQTAAR